MEYEQELQQSDGRAYDQYYGDLEIKIPSFDTLPCLGTRKLEAGGGPHELCVAMRTRL